MNTDQKQQITAALHEWLSKGGNNNGAEMSRKTGYNQAYISQIKNGSYEISGTAIKDEVFNAIAKELGLSFGIQLHWETNNFNRITNLCDLAKNKHRRCLIDGDSGVGKTYALEFYARNNRNVVYIKATTSMTSKDLLSEILLKLRVKDLPKGERKMLQKLESIVAHPGWLIIFDEMEDMKAAIYKTCKEICDFANKKAGVVVSGIELIDYLEKKSKGKKPSPYKQLNRRFKGTRLKLKDVTPKEVEHIVKASGFEDKNVVNWFKMAITDFDTLSQYLTDLLENANKSNAPVATLTADEIIQFLSV